MTTRLDLLERVAEAARRLMEPPPPKTGGTTEQWLTEIEVKQQIREALAALDAAPDDGWRPDRPGWYWVYFESGGTPHPALWHEPTSRWPGYWEGIGWSGVSEPAEIGPYIPLPAARSESGK